MALFTIKGDVLSEVEESPFQLERDLQRVFEKNIESLMALRVVRSEFTIKNKRIDTLAFDEQASAFIIIEYKRDRNLSVVDQGFTYLSLMLENKADFIIEYNERLKGNLKRSDVDWSQTRVAFVSSSFTDNQILATNFKDIGIELWEVKHFSNRTLLVNQIKKTRGAESIKPLGAKNDKLQRVSQEIKVYTEEDHRAGTTEAVYELYERFRDAILNLAEGVELKPQKMYIAFKASRNIACVELQKRKLKIYIGVRAGTLDDPKDLAQDVSQVGHYGTGDYLVVASEAKNLEYILSLIKQAL